mmetsp:Transcript_100420/g.199299  ORF Transcript_100420/g.199299 Transcript_100420/m.199299 type:complete len:647 (+) Transcript_100420:54-1994(+)
MARKSAALGNAAPKAQHAQAGGISLPSTCLPKCADQCAVCLSTLCEPVAWPGCLHLYCLTCSVRTRRRLRPACPLCRAPAPRAQKASDLRVDAHTAAQVRRQLGYSRYEILRREAWSTAASLDSQGSLGELPLFAMGPSWKFQAGARHRLRFFEPRYKEMLRKVTASGGKRCFAAILEPIGFEVGARGRICEIIENGEDSNGDLYAVVEGGSACKILEVAKENIEQGAAPLFHGNMDEVEEEDLSDIMHSAEGDTMASLTAATEMVDLLGALGRQLRSMRRRRQVSALLTDGGDNGNSGEQHVGTARMEDILEDPRTAIGEEEGIGAMLNLLVSYRSIITQMDRLLVEASLTAAHLSLASEHDDDGQSNDHGTRLPAGALIRRAVAASENRQRGAGHAELSTINHELLSPPRSERPEDDLVELLHADEIGRNVSLPQPQESQSLYNTAQPFSFLARDHAHRSVDMNIPQTTTVGSPSMASGQVEEGTGEVMQRHAMRITAVAGQQADERTISTPLHPLSNVEMAPSLQGMPVATVGARRRSSLNVSSIFQDSPDSVQANALEHRRGSSLQSPSLGRTAPNERGSLTGIPGRRRPVPPALRRGAHVSLELPGSGLRRASMQPRQGAVFSRTGTASFPMDRWSSPMHG